MALSWKSLFCEEYGEDLDIRIFDIKEYYIHIIHWINSWNWRQYVKTQIKNMHFLFGQEYYFEDNLEVTV